MTGRYEGDQSTGIYVRRYLKVTSKGFTIGPSANLETLLAGFERQVRHVLTEHKVEISRKTGWPKVKSDFPASAKPIVMDATAILFRVHEVRHLVDKGHAENAAKAGIVLGRALERMGVRPFEKWVLRGKKDYADRQRGAIKAHGTRAERVKGYQKLQKEFDRIAAKKQKLSRYRIAALVSLKFGTLPGTSQRSVLRHTQDHRKSSHC